MIFMKDKREWTERIATMESHSVWHTFKRPTTLVFAISKWKGCCLVHSVIALAFAPFCATPSFSTASMATKSLPPLKNLKRCLSMHRKSLFIISFAPSLSYLNNINYICTFSSHSASDTFRFHQWSEAFVKFERGATLLMNENTGTRRENE